MSITFDEADSATATAQDWLDLLNEIGVQVAWKQRTVTGTTPYGQPKPTLTVTQIPALIGQLSDTEYRFIEPGFQPQHYLKMKFNPTLAIAVLDQITYAGLDYSVRLVYPYSDAGVVIYNFAYLRALLIHQPPP